MEEQKTEDYKERLQKVRQRRNGKDPMHWFMIGGCAVIVVLALVIIVKLAQGGTFGGSGNARVASASEAEVQETVIGETLPEDEEQAKEDEEKKNVVESYQNLGIVDVSGYLNMRERPVQPRCHWQKAGRRQCVQRFWTRIPRSWYQISSGGLKATSVQGLPEQAGSKTEAFRLESREAVIHDQQAEYQMSRVRTAGAGTGSTKMRIIPLSAKEQFRSAGDIFSQISRSRAMR